MRYCKKCGKVIHVKSDFCKDCRTASPRPCACGCGGIVTNPNPTIRFLPYHANKCKEKIEEKKQIMLSKYGVDNISKLQECKDLKKRLSLERYGTECVLQAKEVKEKSKETCLRHYGVDNARKSEIIKEKSKETCLERYGREFVTQTEQQKEKSRETCLRRYGVDNAAKCQDIKDKVRKTMIEHFGCWNSQSLESKEKARKTCLERYGVDWYVQTEQQKQKSRETCIRRYGTEYSSSAQEVKENKKRICREKYGVDTTLLLESVKQKSKKTCLERYGADNPFKIDRIRNQVILRQRNLSWNSFTKKSNWIPQFTKEEFLKKGWKNSDGSSNFWKFKCSQCGSIFDLSTLLIHCKNCKTVGRSFSEKEIFEYVRSILPDNISVISNVRKIMDDTRKELDLYIPEKNLAIEYDGLYWHSVKYEGNNTFSMLNKTNLCLKKNINLIHIIEDEWYNNEDKIKSIIRNKLGIFNDKVYARKCKCSFLNGLEYSDFILNNSLNEDLECAYSVGLFYEDDLVSVMTFRTCKLSDEFELYNFCIKQDTLIVGGFAKMLHFFINHIPTKRIISYVDKTLFTGNCFIKAGFIKLEDLPPTCWYIDGMKRIECKTKNIENPSKYIYDCGSMLFEWTNPNYQE